MWRWYQTSLREKDCWTGTAWFALPRRGLHVMYEHSSNLLAVPHGVDIPCGEARPQSFWTFADQQCTRGGDEEHTCTQHTALLDARAAEGQAVILIYINSALLLPLRRALRCDSESFLITSEAKQVDRKRLNITAEEYMSDVDMGLLCEVCESMAHCHCDLQFSGSTCTSLNI